MRVWTGRLVLAVGLALLPGVAWGQAAPSAVGVSGGGGQLSVFAMGTRDKTGFLGWNDSLTVGLNMALNPKLRVAGIEPLLEARGTWPVHNASTAASQFNFMGGPVVRRRFGRLTPYGNVEFGYGRTDYPSSYYYNGYQYVRSSGFVYGGGGGLEYSLTERLAVKAEIQWQHWNIPVVDSGEAWARPVSLGLSYSLGRASLPHKKPKMKATDPGWHKLSEDYPGTGTQR